MRSTLGMALNTRIPEVLNIGPTDPRCVAFINEAERRMLMRGKYHATYAQYAVNATSQLVSLPPQIATAEAFAVGKQQLPLHDFLYQFIRNGWNVRDSTLPNGSGVSEALLLGQFPTFVDVPTGGSVLTVKCDVALDNGKTVVLLGYDTNGNWIRTQIAGVWTDGLPMILTQGAGNTTPITFSKVTDVQPPSGLSGQWWLYAGTITGTLLSNYQWWEFAPSYKRYLIPFVNSTMSTVDIIGKKAWYPVANPGDYLPVGNLDALKLACMAIKNEEEHDYASANILWNGGMDKKSGIRILGVLDELNYELEHEQGSGRELGITVLGSGGDPVETLV